MKIYGNPLQCSCLENPRDGGAWWAAVFGVTWSRTRLKRLSSSSSSSSRNSSERMQEEATPQGSPGKRARRGHLSYPIFSSVAQSCPTLCNPMDCSMPGLPVHHQLLEFTPTHIILCRPLLLPLSIFPSMRVFSNESLLHIMWPKYWSFSFSISPSNEFLGLISFRID